MQLFYFRRCPFPLQRQSKCMHLRHPLLYIPYLSLFSIFYTIYTLIIISSTDIFVNIAYIKKQGKVLRLEVNPKVCLNKSMQLFCLLTETNFCHIGSTLYYNKKTPFTPCILQVQKVEFFFNYVLKNYFLSRQNNVSLIFSTTN